MTRAVWNDEILGGMRLGVCEHASSVFFKKILVPLLVFSIKVDSLCYITDEYTFDALF